MRVANYAGAIGPVDVRVGGLVLGARPAASADDRRAADPGGRLSPRAGDGRPGGDRRAAINAEPSRWCWRRGRWGCSSLVPRGSGAQLLRLAYDVAPPTPTRQPAVTGTRRFGNAVRCERDTWTPKESP